LNKLKQWLNIHSKKIQEFVPVKIKKLLLETARVFFMEFMGGLIAQLKQAGCLNDRGLMEEVRESTGEEIDVEGLSSGRNFFSTEYVVQLEALENYARKKDLGTLRVYRVGENIVGFGKVHDRYKKIVKEHFGGWTLANVLPEILTMNVP